MVQSILADSITKHLDALFTLTNYAILLALAVTWAGLQHDEELQILGMKFTRRQALFAVSPIYLITNLSVLILFLRIGDLLWSVEASQFPEAFTRISTHPWLLNPFAFFGTTPSAMLYQHEGYGLLIVIWWLCNTSLLALVDDIQERKRSYVLFVAIFLVIGLGSMIAINRVFSIVHVRMALLNPALQHGIGDAISRRAFEAFLGVGIGGLLHYRVLSKKSHPWLKSTKHKFETDSR